MSVERFGMSKAHPYVGDVKREEALKAAAKPNVLKEVAVVAPEVKPAVVTSPNVPVSSAK